MKNDQFLVLFRLLLVSDQFDDFDLFHIWGAGAHLGAHFSQKCPLGKPITQASISAWT